MKNHFENKDKQNHFEIKDKHNKKKIEKRIIFGIL